MTNYTDVFGGANIYPSEISYSALALTTSVYLSWPEETSASENLATRIMDISASAGLSIYLPAANRTATGNTILFNNTGAETITVRTSTGVQVVTVDAGCCGKFTLRTTPPPQALGRRCNMARRSAKPMPAPWPEQASSP